MKFYIGEFLLSNPFNKKMGKKTNFQLDQNYRSIVHWWWWWWWDIHLECIGEPCECFVAHIKRTRAANISEIEWDNENITWKCNKHTWIPKLVSDADTRYIGVHLERQRCTPIERAKESELKTTKRKRVDAGFWTNAKRFVCKSHSPLIYALWAASLSICLAQAKSQYFNVYSCAVWIRMLALM